MSETKGSGNDPSMDDILASIRKIISDDEARAQVNTATHPESGQTAASPLSAASDDVLLLTDLVDEPKGAPSRPTAVPSPAKTDPVTAAPMPQPSIAPASAPAPAISAVPPVASVEASVKQPLADRGLVEPGAARLAASAFDRLSQAVQESDPTPTPSDPGSSGRNLEDIVKELLQPMLKEWLDKNLPAMVERSVEREIVRLTRR